MTQSHTPTNCKPGSAWDTWQRAGARVRSLPFAAIQQAANDFAYGDAFHWPIHGQQARYRAFMEGALA